MRPIDELQRRAAADGRVIGLGGGLPSPAQFPRRALTTAFLQALGDPSASALQYGWPEGIEGLRAHIARRLRDRGAAIGPDRVIVTHGAQQALALAITALCTPGDAVAVGAASYPAALDLFRTHGLRPTAGWEDGSVVYTMPALANPEGSALPADLRARLLSSGRPLVEDDAYAELRFDGSVPRPLVADAPDRVWHVGTFSKTLAPGLRIGWLVPPEDRLEEVRALKQGDDLHANSLSQAIVDRVLSAGGYDERLSRLRTFYRRRARRLAEAVAEHLPGWRFAFPEGGYSLWVALDHPVDEVAFLEGAIASGVAFDPGSLFEAAPGPEMRVRLSFSWADPGAFDEGAARLARAWAHVGSS